MARVRSKDTVPEKRVRTVAHSMGLRFRLHRKDLAGQPDLVFPQHKVAIFVHGCFWHQHPNCRRASVPQTRRAFWTNKLSGNVRRDGEATRALRADGWRVAVIWECETKDGEEIERKLAEIFSKSGRRRKTKGTA
ncbi:very short patch repair endonuclease [Bradyrhizobium sp. HKCCYLRH1030]|uniref:very short patch repair endonuclease n=1 Tax=Bradyrhizobium sp. HKCCYLRH1030 TaxID=3420744 RepID=UPI003EB9C2DB